jgi:serine/threonine-protein kinase RsbW
VTHVVSDLPPSDEDSAAPDTSQKPVMSIELRTTASALAIPTIRTVAADLAARADFDLDSIDDLRMAVDDVCAMLVGIAAENGTLSCSFTVLAERIELKAEVEADHLIDPLPKGTFDRRVLESLVDEVSGVLLPGKPHPGAANSDASPLAPRGRIRITLAKGTLAAP